MRNPLAKPFPPTVVSIIQLLEVHPQDWTFCEHYATHIGGARIWIANGDWAARITIPGCGEVFSSHRDCKATAAHKALYQAARAAQATQIAGVIADYISGSQSQRERKARDEAERARRLDYAAGTFDHEAALARQRAANLRAAAEATLTAAE